MRRLALLSFAFALFTSARVAAEPGGEKPPARKLGAIFTRDLSDGFFDKLREVCRNLKCEPLDLLKVMMSESAVRATAHNPNGHASGLIQIMPDNLPGLGWKKGHEAFRQ